MEHRWGQRVAVKMPVCFDIRPHAASWMRDVSASGAFIETVPLFPIFSLLHVKFIVDGSIESVPAYVARVCGDGMGVEWCTFAPNAICAMIRPARDIHRSAYENS